MKKTCLEGLYTWGRLQPDRLIDFNGFLWARPDGGVLFDPMELDDDEARLLAELGGATRIVLTNFDHLRATAELKERLGAEVYAPEGERERFGEAADLVDGWYTAADGLPPELGIAAHALHGGKSEVEMALFLEPIGALLFGDAVRSHEAGLLRLLPDPKLSDRAALVEDLQSLASLPIRAVLLGDGESHYYRAAEAYADLLERESAAA
jgi:glyoxylase-like metal-dependent hydrolase (beta-lactamase superfamily II)